VIEGDGSYLLPGLVDFHVHPNSPEELTSFVYYGVTTIAAFDGEPLVWRRKHIALPDIRPHIISTTTILDGDPPTNRRRYVIGSAADVGAILDHEKSLGAEMAKIYNALRLPEFTAVVAEAHKRGMPVVGHIPKVSPDVLFGGNGMDLVAHGEEFLNILPEDASDLQIDQLARTVVSHDVAVNPDLVAVHQIPEQATNLAAVLADPKMLYMPSSMYQEWLPRNNSYSNRENLPKFVASIGKRYAVQLRMIQRLRELGAIFVTGTDAPDTCVAGDCIHIELGLLHAAGLTNYEALRTVTANTGEFVRKKIAARSGDLFGIIEPGAIADIILVRGNPLEDLGALREISGVMVGGVWRTDVEVGSARDAALPLLRVQHGYVDTYERLFASGNLPGTIEFLDSIPNGEAPIFGDSQIPYDAVRLGRNGNPYDGILLLEHARRLMPDTLGIYHPLAQLMMQAHDLAGARDVYRGALDIAPRDATSVEGILKIDCLESGKTCLSP
jgi:hypothetical protein